MMFKVLILQHLYNLPDEEIEYQIADRISFQRSLGFPKTILDHTTIWRFREYLSDLNLHDNLWEELNKQIAGKGIQL
jgi:transposase, IS5 family